MIANTFALGVRHQIASDGTQTIQKMVSANVQHVCSQVVSLKVQQIVIQECQKCLRSISIGVSIDTQVQRDSIHQMIVEEA